MIVNRERLQAEYSSQNSLRILLSPVALNMKRNFFINQMKLSRGVGGRWKQDGTNAGAGSSKSSV